MQGRRHRTLQQVPALVGDGLRVRARLVSGMFICRLVGGTLVLTLLLFRAMSIHKLVDAPSLKPRSPMRLLLMTLEYKKSTFSGNGVYAQSIARSLARKGISVLVLSANPSRVSGPTNHGGGHERSRMSEIDVEVEGNQWGRLDWKCPWQSFANGITPNVAKQVMEFNPSWILVVDWSALPAFLRLRESTGSQQCPMAFLNFRIYYISEYKGERGAEEKEFYRGMESRAVSMASAIAALSYRDANLLLTKLGNGISPDVLPRPLFPPLREDIRSLATTSPKSLDEWHRGRKYISCCVRLSPEKNAELFAFIIERLSAFIMEQGIVPFLCGGAHGGGDYAESVKLRVKTAFPNALIYEGFMGSTQLADIYSQTLLNVHPCIYDAYGMTIVEAAAFEAPSLVHVGPGGAVGAAEFLDPDKGQVFGLDLSSPIDILSKKIKELLLDRWKLAQIGRSAGVRSLSWGEDANAEQLLTILGSSSQTFKSSSEIQSLEGYNRGQSS